jgi:alcohol dehydrogenase
VKAFVVERYGKSNPLRAVDLPEPEIRGDEVLVRVCAASVNVLDAKIRAGEFKLLLPYKTPFVLGHDVAGVVERVGEDVRHFKQGDEVYARADDLRIGTFAEFIAIRESSVAFKPANLTMEEAASLPLVALTAWQALVEIGKVTQGQKVFIQAGSGGVGSVAIQLAKHLGATVATTTGTSNVPWVKELGADHVIDYRQEDFESVLQNYDLVLNSQDGETLQKSLRVLKPGGKLISISGPPDPEFARNIKAPWLVRQVVSALSWGIRRNSKKREIDYSFLFMKPNGRQLGEIALLVEIGALRPVVDKIFPFAATNEALAHVEQGRAKGKVVIKIA